MKNMHRKSAFSLGISNSNLACVIIDLQRTRKVKKKKKSKFRLSTTLKGNAVEEPLSKAVYVRFYSKKVKNKQEKQVTHTYALIQAKSFMEATQ